MIAAKCKEEKNMIPIILISNQEKKIEQYLNDFIVKNNFSPFSIFRISPENRNINLDQIREIRKLIMTTAQNKRLIIIHLFDKALQEAQNALLKTLEEPGDNQFILTSTNEENILATIRSRAKLVYLDKDLQADSKKDKKEADEIEELIASMNANSYQFLKSKKIDKISREDAIGLLDQIMLYFQNKLHEKKSKADQIIKQSFKLKKLLDKNNLNPQLTVDNFLIWIKKTIDPSCP